MAKMRVAVVTKPGADFEIQEREIPKPGLGEVRIKVQACGICYSDHLTKDGVWPGIVYPHVPGHEVAGVVDEVGAGVTEWKKGDRVGAGWHGGHDFVCESCRRGDFGTCKNGAITGITRDGGYQEYMLARHEAVARIPDDQDGLGEPRWTRRIRCDFRRQSGVRAMIEKYPLEKVNDAFARMMSGKAQFRVVLTM
jgi:D-arabinose 1-dehydrogenase-like Zn-dependent alcohol dehydrogenase